MKFIPVQNCVKGLGFLTRVTPICPHCGTKNPDISGKSAFSYGDKSDVVTCTSCGKSFPVVWKTAE